MRPFGAGAPLCDKSTYVPLVCNQSRILCVREGVVPKEAWMMTKAKLGLLLTASLTGGGFALTGSALGAGAAARSTIAKRACKAGPNG